MPELTKARGRGTNVILGYGKFGRRAASCLQKMIGRKDPIIVVDQKIQSASSIQGISFVRAEAIEWFSDYFTPTSEIARIIPALPRHLAAGWLSAILSKEGWIVYPYILSDTLLEQLPHAIRVNRTSAVTSHADFLCPENCPEPRYICTHTRQPRPLPLYKLLRSLPLDLKGVFPIVVESRQFAPGIGGFFPEDLWEMLDFVKQLPQLPSRHLLIATACKCHGIVDGLILERPT